MPKKSKARTARAFLRSGDNPFLPAYCHAVLKRIEQNGANGLTIEWMGRNTPSEDIPLLADCLDSLLDQRAIFLRNDSHCVAVSQIPEPKRGKILGALWSVKPDRFRG